MLTRLNELTKHWGFNMSYTILDLEQGSQEWIEARFDYITASQVPVILGMSPYTTPIELFEEKLLRVTNPPPGKKEYIFNKGHQIERLARDWASKELNLEFKPMVLISNILPELMASLDGINEPSRIILEVKYVGKEKLKEISQGDIPPHHGAQVQAELLVSGASRCIYFASNGTESVMQDIFPDLSEFESIAEEVKRFSKRLKDGNPPELTDKDYKIVDDPDFKMLQVLKSNISATEDTYEALKEALFAKYPDHKRVKCGGVSLIRGIRKGTIQYKNIEELKNVDLEAHRGKPTVITTVKFEGAKK